MQYVTSQVTRRIVGRLEMGDELPAALVAVCQREGVEAGQVRAEGVLSYVDLGLFSIDEGQYRGAFEAEGAFEMLSLRGLLTRLGPELLLSAHVLVAYPGHGESHVVGGQLRAALVHAVEFVIDVFEDVRLTRALDPETRLPLLRGERRPDVAPRPSPAAVPAPSSPAPPRASEPHARPEPPVRPEPARTEPARPEPARPEPARTEPAAVTPAPEAYPPRPATPAERIAGPERPVISSMPTPERSAPVASESDWAQAARKSQRMLASRVEDESDWVELEPGDILMHPRLGECTVVRVDDETSAYIRIKKSRRISKLALTVIRLEAIGERDGKRVFEVRAGGA